MRPPPPPPLGLGSGYATARLRVEPLSLGDAEALFAVLSDLALYRHMQGPPPAHVQSVVDSILRHAAHNASNGNEPSLNWTLWLPSGLPIGQVQATLSAGEAWLGYALASSHWRQGYASEAVAGLIGHLCQHARVERCLALVDVDNAASIRVLEKLGFRDASAEASAAGRVWAASERLFALQLFTSPAGAQPPDGL